jgi:hypothetical protein
VILKGHQVHCQEEQLSGISDRRVLLAVTSLSGAATLASMATEVAVKVISGTRHVGVTSFIVYVGARQADRYTDSIYY